MLDERRLVRGVVLQVLYELDSTTHNQEEVLKFYSGIGNEADSVRIIGYLTIRRRFENTPIVPPPPTTFELSLNKPIDQRTPVEQVLIDGLTEGLDPETEFTDDQIAEIIHLIAVPDDEEFDMRLTDPGELLPIEHQKQIHHLAREILNYREQLDAIILHYAPEYPIDQLAIIDRNILRLAIYQFGIAGDIPIRVAISEAVELAKIFGSDSSYRFVNGVLGSLASRYEQIIKELRETKQSKSEKEGA